MHREDDLELIVAAANISGYMEASGQIHVESDMKLVGAIARLLEEYSLACKVGEPSFPEFAQDFLLGRFCVED